MHISRMLQARFCNVLVLGAMLIYYVIEIFRVPKTIICWKKEIASVHLYLFNYVYSNV
jgi:hypothetical protein